MYGGAADDERHANGRDGGLGFGTMQSIPLHPSSHTHSTNASGKIGLLTSIINEDSVGKMLPSLGTLSSVAVPCPLQK